MKRRHFLEHSLAGVAGASLLGPMTSSLGSSRLQSFFNILEENDKILVIINMNGGNDGLNTIVPLDYMSELSVLREGVFIPESQLLRSSANNGTLAFHPAMQEIRDLYEDGKVHIVQNVGYEDQNFSHFRSADIWMSGSESDEFIGTGIMGRYLEERFQGFPEGYPNEKWKDPVSIETGFSNSLLFNGQSAPMSYLIQNIDDFYELLSDEFSSSNPDTPAGNRHDFIQLIRRQSDAFGMRIAERAQTVPDNLQYYPDTDLGRQLAAVARLIGGGIETPIYKVEYFGFDTHSAQVDGADPTNHQLGLHAELLRILSQSVKAFMDDLDRMGMGDKVIGVTFSEFGRTILSNGSGGTDHGSAAPMILFGNSVQGGVSGSNPVLDSGMTYADNLPYEFDFKNVYSSIFEEWFCADKTVVNEVMRNEYDPIGLIENSPCSVVSTRETHFPKDRWVSLIENPIRQEILIQSKKKDRIMRIRITTVDGHVLINRTLYGRHSFSTSALGLKQGIYFLEIYQGGQINTLKMMKI